MYNTRTHTHFGNSGIFNNQYLIGCDYFINTRLSLIEFRHQYDIIQYSLVQLFSYQVNYITLF